MTRLILIAFIVFITQLASAQSVFTGTKNNKAEKLFGEALHFFSSMENKKALVVLDKCIKEDPKFIDAYMLKADIYEQNEQFVEAISIYHQIIAMNAGFQIPYYKLAKAALDDGMYDTALINIKLYQQYKGNQIQEYKVKKIYATALFGSEAVKHPVPFNPINLGPGVNTSEDEYFPGVTADEQLLFYTRLLNGRNEDFFYSQKKDNAWQLSQNMGEPINTASNEGSISITADGQYAFFTACNYPEGAGSCDIYFATLDGNQWRTPKNLGFPINTNSWESQPSVSYDGKTLYFTSSRPGGYGGMDIWFSTYTKGLWSAPQNLGPTVNTPGDEQAPVIAKDDQTMYFNSDGHPGMGAMDLYYVRKQADGKWGKPINMGYPINTHKSEVCFAIAANGKDAYISMEREGGAGGLDLYQFELYEEARPVKTGYLKGVVYDVKTLAKLRARIELIDLETGKTVIESASNKVSGDFLVCLPGNRNYALNVSLDGYLFYSENFELKNQPGTDPLLMNIPLCPVLPGEKVVLKNIFFDVDKFTLREESKIEMAKLVGFMKSNPTIRIELSGHTDNTGTRPKNTELSTQRAKSVYDYLVQQGITATRLTYKGYADWQPIADNNTEQGRQKNRRTEFKVLSK